METIRIRYQPGMTLQHTQLLDFQGSLKELSEENYQKLKNEIIKTGFAFAPHAWQNTSDQQWYLVDGHQRIHTLKRLAEEGWQIPPIPVIRVEADSYEEAKRRVLQGTSQYGTMTQEGLKTFIIDSKIPIEDIRVSFQFPEVNLPSFVDTHFRAPPEATEKEEDAPELKPGDLRVRPGDMFQLGRHKLLCGDSTNAEVVTRLLGGIKAEMVFTDPPYGVDYTGGMRFNDDGSVETNTRERIQNDKTSDIYTQVIPILAQFCDGPCYTWFAGSLGARLYAAIEQVGDVHALLVWNKVNAGFGALNAHYKQKHEVFLYWKPKGSTLRWHGPANEITIWEQKRAAKNEYHPTQKPVELPERAMLNHDARTVLDLFGGSGSTLIAAEKTGRSCYMMELDPTYCAVILDRWAKFTQLGPIREDGTPWSNLSQPS